MQPDQLVLTLHLFFMYRRVCLHILIYIITIPVSLCEYRGTMCAFSNRYLVCCRNSFQRLKYYLNDIDIAFGVMSFSYSILTTISILYLLLSFGIFVCNTTKIFLFSRFRKIKGVFVSIFVFTFSVSFFSQRLFLNGDIETNQGPRSNLNNHFTICH